MNRRRVGLAALIIGAGAVVRRRLKTRVDAGPDQAASEVATPTRTPTSDSARPAEPPAAGSVASSSIEPVTTEASVVEDVRGDVDAWVASATLGNPEIDTSAPALSHVTGAVPPSPESESQSPSENVPPSPELESQSPSENVPPSTESESQSPSENVPPSPESEQELDDTDGKASPSIPAIVLPTMPAAGSRADTARGTDATTMADVSPEPVGEPAASPARATENTLPENSLTDSVPSTPLPLATTLAESIASTTAVDTAVPTTDRPSFAPPAPSVHPGPIAAKSTKVPDPPAAREPFYRAHRVWTIVGTIMLGLLATAFLAALFVRLPYYRLEPGAVYDTIGRVDAPGDMVSIPNGEIGFVTVAQTANITPLQWLDAKLDNNVRIRHEDEVRGDQTADELREADLRRMQVSKNSAVVVALQKLGFELIVTPIGVEVAQVFDCTAADGTLGTGDLIVGVNGVEVLSGEALVEQLMNQAIGDEVDLLIERIDPANPTQSMRTDLVAITLGSADADCLPDEVRAEEPRPFIGIGTLPIFEEELPIDVDLRTGRVSGPSAGLAFTLAIMDVLSEGDLTNGLNVVATGSIQRDGSVGPVGGIHQKTIAAERSGADVFIVPRCCDNFVDSTSGEPLDLPGNYDEALLYAEDMIVIGVDTLDEALVALGELGGDVDPFLNQETP